METFKSRFRRLISLALLTTLIVGSKVITAQEDLAPDQNPNYKKSQEKYMAKKDSLTKNEGTTVQATYKAIDDTQIKQEQKDLRRSNRQDRRLARINNRRYYYRSPYYNNNSMYYNNSRYPYNNSGYNNNYGYNSYNPYQNYSPYNNYNNYYQPSYGYGLNAVGNLALFGLGAYLLLHH